MISAPSGDLLEPQTSQSSVSGIDASSGGKDHANNNLDEQHNDVNVVSADPLAKHDKKGKAGKSLQANNANKSKEKGKKDEADTTRELLEISICSIQLSNLIPAHRFKKNLPWIKCDYGEHHWEYEYQPDSQGESADFLDLQWKFLLQRDTRHREDLIVTVISDIGSGSVILGRYLLGADEFVNMPVTKTGYFKVSGKIVNALGIAGKITIVFKKHIAEPPKAPRFIEATPGTIVANTLPHDARSYIRIVSIACADLKPINTFNLNSPHCVLTCHDWKKTTDVQVDAGLAAKWNRLPWKLVMNKFYPLLVEVKSERDLIGMVQFTLDELRNAETDERGFKEIIRQLTDGSTFSGRIRMLLYMVDMLPTADQNTFHAEVPGLRYDDEEDAANAARARGEIYSKLSKPAHAGLELSSNLIKGSITFCPFVMRVMEAGVFDTKKCHPFKPNSLSLNAACGAWGGSTFQVKNCGSDAYWVGMNNTWRFVVEDTSVLRLNVWSKDIFVGTVDVKAKEIMAYPIDPDGNTEIMLALKDEGKTTGRLRLNCVFEYFRKGENTNYDPQPEPVVYIPPRAKKLEIDSYGDVPKYELPCIAKIISVSLVDLKSVHTFSRNSPRVKIVCDRKQALTSVLPRAGKSARWVDLDWDIPLNEGCIMMIYCSSSDVPIGFVELEAHHIADEPLDNYGMTNISRFLRNHDGLSTGKLTIIMQLQNVPDLQVYDAIVNGLDRDPYNLTKSVKSHVVKDEVDPVLQLLESKPFFSLADATVTGIGIMLCVEISEIDVTDLDAVHYFGKKNSPMVSAACGRWADTTFAQTDAGESTFWTGLTWKFLMDDDLSVQFVVGSRKKVIGSVKCSAKQFAVARADQRGFKRVTLNMYKEQRGMHHFTGRLKLTYKLSVVRESQYIQRPLALERMHVEELSIPFNATVKRVVARGMPRVHTLGPNEPRFRMSYDDWSKTTSVSTSGVSEEAEWKEADLPPQDWTSSVCDESMFFTLTMISASELIGIAEISASDVMKIPRSVKGIAEVVVPLQKEGKTMGRLQVFLYLANDKQAGPAHSQEEEDAELERLAMEEVKAKERQQYWQAKQMLLGDDVIKQQQAQIRPILAQRIAVAGEADPLHDSRFEAESRRLLAEHEINRMRIESQMVAQRDQEMLAQHKLMISQSFRHKYAPVGDHPAGYIPPAAVQTSVQAPSSYAMFTPQSAPTMRLSGLQAGAALEGSDDEDYSEGYDPNGVRAFVPSDGSIVDLKSANPSHLPANVHIVEDVSMLDMEDFNDEGSISAGAGLLQGTKIVQTVVSNPVNFEGNMDDDASHLSINSNAVKRSNFQSKGQSSAKVLPGSLVLGDVEPDDGIRLISTDEGFKVKAKTYKQSGLLTNKFEDHEVGKQRHMETQDVAYAYTINIRGVSVLDVPSAHIMTKNSLQATCICTGAAAGVDPNGTALAATGPVEFASDVMPSCGDAATWSNLEWDFPLIYGKRRQLISINLSSGKKTLGSFECKADDLYLASLQEKSGTLIRKFADMREGANFMGKIKLIYTAQML